MTARATLCAAWALTCGAALLWALAIYPLERGWLAAATLMYIVLLAMWPRCWLFALPALLPALDLAPRTGWFFLEEVDLLLLATAACCYWRMARKGASAGGATQVAVRARYPGPLLLLFSCLMMLCLAAAWHGLQPMPRVDANSFNNYLSPYNALRIAKGWLWALVLLPAMRHDAGPTLDGIQRYLVPGMLAGLVLVCYDNLRERILFPGLLNFSTDYRSTAPFSAMHTGGAALDGYLALSFPLIAFWLTGRAHPQRILAALALLAAAGYVGLATFSRGLMAAYLFSALLLIYNSWRQAEVHGGAAARHSVNRLHWIALAAAVPALNAVFRSSGYRVYALALLTVAMAWLALVTPRPLLRQLTLRPGAVGAGLPLALRHHSGGLAALLLLALAIPFANGYYTGERLASSQSDLRLRLAHWRHTLMMMRDDPQTRLFGMGFGTFPATYHWHNPQGEQPGNHRFVDRDNNRYLRLGSADYPAGYGEMLRILQQVGVRPDTPYLISFDARGAGNDAFLYASLCERELLYPQNCLPIPRQHLTPGAAWRHFQFALQSGPVGSPTGPWRPPIQLEFSIEGTHAAVDIDNVSLRDALSGHELIRNGAFSDANNYWFFSSDRYHLPWHIKNLALNIYFEMGWTGLMCFTTLFASAYVNLARRARQRDPSAITWLASLLSFQLVGLFDSLLDVPRIALLFLLVLGASQLRPGVPR